MAPRFTGKHRGSQRGCGSPEGRVFTTLDLKRGFGTKGNQVSSGRAERPAPSPLLSQGSILGFYTRVPKLQPYGPQICPLRSAPLSSWIFSRCCRLGLSPPGPPRYSPLKVSPHKSKVGGSLFPLPPPPPSYRQPKGTCRFRHGGVEAGSEGRRMSPGEG